MSARDSLLAAVSFNDAANAGSTPEEMVDAAIAERDAQIIEWLEKKAGEAVKVPRSRQERTADTIARLASKLSRGAVRSPLSPAHVEYGIRVTPNASDSELLSYPGWSRSRVEERLVRHRAGSPDARLLQRTVRRGMWTEADELPCARCNSTGIDPEDSHPAESPSFYSMGEPPALEPCGDCGPGATAP